MSYLVVKSLHLFFVVAWFAGLFYLPRLYVNLAMSETPAERERLLLMSGKLYRFMTPLAGLALLLGLWLWFGFGISGGWLHAKLLLVAALVGPEWRRIYDHALRSGYRFLSYGDGSLLLPDEGVDNRAG